MCQNRTFASSISGGRLEPGFSPWEAPAAFGTEAFDGQGARTLKWLLEEGVPYIDRTYHVKEQEHWLASYSLAGLFALWAAYECDTFAGIACCSGSLWFKDWDIYMREHKLKRKCGVYLSLGGKEEKDEERSNGSRGRPHQGTRKIIAGRSICRAGSIRVESRRTFRRFREAPGKRNSMAVRKIEIIAAGKIVIILNHKGLRRKSTLIK